MRGFGRLLAGLGAARGLDFAFYLVLARTLGAERFGVYTYALSLVLIGHVLTDLGLGIVVTREVARRPERTRALLAHVMKLKLALAALTLAATSGAALVTRADAELTAAILLFTLAMIANSAALSFEGVLKAAGRAGGAGVAALAQSATGLAVGAGLLLAGAGVFAGVLAYLAAALVHVTVAAARSRDLWRGPAGVPAEPGAASRERRALLREALPVALSGVFIVLYFRIDAVMLHAMAGERAVGLYGGAYRLFESLGLASAAARSVLFPLMARAADGPAAALRALARRTIRLQLTLATGLVVFVAMRAEAVVDVLLGAAFAEAAPVLFLLMWAVPLAFMADMLLAFLTAQGRQALGTWAVGAVALFNVGLNLVLIPRFSFAGAAAATLASEVLAFSLLVALFARGAPGLGLASLTWRPLLAGAALAAALSGAERFWPPGEWGLALSAAAAAAVYAGALAAAGGVTADDLLLARRFAGLDDPAAPQRRAA